MTDPLIESLVADLKPQKPLANIKLWLESAVGLFLMAAIILAVMGVRDDYAQAIQTGAMFWKPAIFLLALLSAILLVIDLSRPTGKLQPYHLLPVLISALILGWQFIAQADHASFPGALNILRDQSALICLPTIFLGGLLMMALIWKFWLSKAASQHPALLGAVAGLSSGALVATAYALHCDRDAALYISVYYLLPILALALMGALLGKKHLRW